MDTTRRNFIAGGLASPMLASAAAAARRDRELVCSAVIAEPPRIPPWSLSTF